MNPYGDAIVTHWDVMPDGSNPIPRADEGLRTVCIGLIYFMGRAQTWADVKLASDALHHITMMHEALFQPESGVSAGSKASV